MKIGFLLALLLAQQCQSNTSESTASPAAHAVAGEDFRSRLAKGKDVVVENQDIREPLDFTALATAYPLAGGVFRATIPGSVTFRKCHFYGSVSAWRSEKGGPTTAISFAKNLTFEECTFDGEVNFRACVVQDLACFAQCFFAKKANFEEADFGNQVLFTGVHFQEEARFSNAFFRKKADFLHAEFSRTANFQGAAFALDAQFGDVKSYQAADFSTAQFQGHAFFNYAEWHGRATFEEAWFRQRCEFMNGKMVNVSLRNCWFLGEPKFNQASVDIGLDVEGAHWLGEKPDWTGVSMAKVAHYKAQ